MIVAGLYSVLWGKYKENKEIKEREAMALPVALKGIEANGQALESIELSEVDAENKNSTG